MLFIAYNESRSGGGISKGEENESWPSYDDENKEIYLSELMVVNEYLLNGDTIDVDFDITDHIGKPLYIVFVKYTTGGTFGCSHGNPYFPACCITAKEAFDIENK